MLAANAINGHPAVYFNSSYQSQMVSAPFAIASSATVAIVVNLLTPNQQNWALAWGHLLLSPLAYDFDVSIRADANRGNSQLNFHVHNSSNSVDASLSYSNSVPTVWIGTVSVRFFRHPANAAPFPPHTLSRN